MRTLRWHPQPQGKRMSTMEALEAFHVTGLVWAYIHDPAVIAEVHASGRFFQGAVTNSLSTVRDLLGLPLDIDGAQTQRFISRYGCLSLDGSANEQPWKRHWANPFSRASGCCSNPDFEALYVDALETYVKAGALMIQRDEGIGNAYRPNYGGCFCDHCMRGFREFLRERLSAAELARLGIERIEGFDYRSVLTALGAPVGDAFSRWEGGPLQDLFRDYQHHVSVGFMARTRAALNKRAGFTVAMSCNNGVSNVDAVMQQFDWFFGELNRIHATPANLYRTASQAAALHRLQIVTMPKKGGHQAYEDAQGWERHTRQTIATAYAAGAICMVPWDVYMPNTFAEDGTRSSTPRYFGKPAEYADLFGFIRANAALLDGYEHAAAVGPGLFETRWGRQFPVLIDNAENVYAFVRARPDRPSAAVVIHLVDWRHAPAPFRLRVRHDAFFPAGEMGLRLHTPAAYRSADHVKAEKRAQSLRRSEGRDALFGPEQSSAYASFVQRQSLKWTRDGPFLVTSLPALTPWGILEVGPTERQADD